MQKKKTSEGIIYEYLLCRNRNWIWNCNYELTEELELDLELVHKELGIELELQL